MQWADLMTQLSVQYPDAAARVICDFLNEPDFGNLRWEAQPDQGLPGMKDLYLNAMDEIYNITTGKGDLSTWSMTFLFVALKATDAGRMTMVLSRMPRLH